jgi:peptidoglycan lytic transglycosylase
MRSMRILRKSRKARVAAGALMLTVPSSAVALAVGQADAQSEVQIDVSSGHVGYGQHVTVNGTVPSGTPGEAVSLEFEHAGATRWQTVGSTRLRGDGRFRFVPALRQSGLLRAVVPGAGRTSHATIPNVGSPAVPSSPRQVSVASSLELRRRSMEVLGGQAVSVRGTLLAGVRGRKVLLEGRRHGAWHLVASARTGSRGGFRIRYRPGNAAGGSHGQELRVQFRGDRLNTGALARAGRVTQFNESVASWYDDAGNTACGFHAGLGVANKVLPCGTRVTFHYGGHTVTAVVDDRGPFAGGREWDLNQNTAGALGFNGVATVWSTV